VDLVQRHADGPEIMASGLRPPASGNFSLGVWENLGAGVYELNHFGIGWDPSNLSGPLGPPTILVGSSIACLR
jgi:hypothetical protein